VISGSVLLIKATDDRGARIISKTLTATQLRAFEQDERLLSHPADALNFLAESTPPPSLTEGGQSAAADRAPLISQTEPLRVSSEAMVWP
jgi:hypothetical protein